MTANAQESPYQTWINGGPCPCWWTTAHLHGGHCCFRDETPDNPGEWCHHYPGKCFCHK